MTTLVLNREGALYPLYQQRLHELRDAIRELQITFPNGLVRQLAVKKLYEYSTELQNISTLLCLEADMLPDQPQHDRALGIREIAETTSASFGVDVLLRSRKKEVCMARHAFVYLTRRFTRLSLQDIGDFYEADHSTVIHSVQVCRDLMQTDPEYRKKVNDLISYFTRINELEK